MARFCKKCGAQMDDSAPFCPACGAAAGLPTGVTPQQQYDPSQQQFVPPPQQFTPPPQQYPPQQFAPPPQQFPPQQFPPQPQGPYGQPLQQGFQQQPPIYHRILP